MNRPARKNVGRGHKVPRRTESSDAASSRTVASSNSAQTPASIAPAGRSRAGIARRFHRRGELLRRRRIRRSALIGLIAVPVTGATVVAFALPLLHGSAPKNAAVEAIAGPGHGRGMSQVGALDRATSGATADAILAHYYPGAQLGTIGPTTVRVRLTVYDNETLDVYSDSGLMVAGRRVVSGQAAHLTPTPGGGANVVVTIGCDGDVLWQGSTDDPWAYPTAAGSDRPAAEHLKVCDGHTFRGALGVTQDGGQPVTVNQLDVEDYLLGVVPAEMQANWADKGGAEALRAQAITARSYALAEQRYPYAQTCDTTDCQVYPGTEKEDPRAAAAVHSTAGQVLLRDGHILRTEYSKAPDGGQPIDINTLEVGPTPGELESAPTVPAPAAPAPPVPEQQVRGDSAIETKYAESGGAAGPLGKAIGPESLLPGRGGTFRLYTGGVIIATPTLGARIVDFSRLLQMAPEAAQSASAAVGAQDDTGGLREETIAPAPSADEPGQPPAGRPDQSAGDQSGQSPADQSGALVAAQSGQSPVDQPLVDPSGRPTVGRPGQPSVDQAGSPPSDPPAQLPVDQPRQ